MSGIRRKKWCATPRLESLETRETPAILALDASDVPLSVTGGSDFAGDIAMRADGTGFVVAYVAPDASANDGVFFKRFDANWQLVQGPIAVNTFTTNGQNDASVALDAAGNFVIAYTSFGQETDTAAQGNIYARRFNAAGAAIDANEFRVNTVTTSNQREPDVAVNAAGQFVIAFRSSAGGLGTGDIFGQSYTSVTGTLATVGVNALVNDPAYVDSQTVPTVVIDSSANYVMTWQSNGQDGSGFGIYARRMLQNGTTNGAFLVNTGATVNSQQFPDIGMDSSGNFTIVWYSEIQVAVSPFDVDIFMQRYNSSATAQGSNTRVNTNTTNGQINPHIAINASGATVVTWEGEEADNDALGADAYFQRYSGAGATAVGTETRLNQSVSNDISDGNATPGINSAGDFVVVFDSNGATSDAYYRRYAEAPVAQLTVGTQSVSEGVGSVNVSVNRTGGLYVLNAFATSVTLNRTGGTATPGSDFSSGAFPSTFTVSGTATSALSVPITNDTAAEADETIVVGLTINTAGHTLGSPSSQTLTIEDNDAGAIAIAGGNNQVAAVNTAFGSALSVTVTNTSGAPIAGASVTFTAPASGASARFSNSTNTITVVTNASGVASSGAVSANAIGGVNYSVSATASGGSSPSTTFTLSNTAPPSVTANPGNQNVTIGQMASFTAAATGTPTPTVQWQVSISNGPFNNIGGATSTTYTFTPTITDSGNRYQAVFTNSGGTATTTIATLTVNKATVSGNATVNWGSAGTSAATTAGDCLRLLATGRTLSMPWLGINKLAITLNAPVPLVAGDVQVTGTTVANYGPVTITGTTPNFVITLNQPINVLDRVTVTLGNASVNTFTRRLDVLPSDVIEDGVVNTTDLVNLRNRIGTTGTLAVQADYNGDGGVSLIDFNAARPRIGTALPGPLFAAPGGVAAASPLPAATALTPAALAPILTEAIRRWQATGLTPAQSALLATVTATIEDIPGTYLGLTPLSSTAIRIDDDAVGYGWYVDPAPQDDSEFARIDSATRRLTTPALAPAGRMDLLTAVLHELGHVLGRDSAFDARDANGIMYAYLTTGERRLPNRKLAGPSIAFDFAILGDSPFATMGVELNL